MRWNALANNIPQMRWMWILLYYFPVESYLEWRWIPSFHSLFHSRIVELGPPSDTVSLLTHAASAAARTRRWLSRNGVLVTPLPKLSIGAKLTMLHRVNRKVPSPKLFSIRPSWEQKEVKEQWHRKKSNQLLDTIEFVFCLMSEPCVRLTPLSVNKKLFLFQKFLFTLCFRFMKLTPPITFASPPCRRILVMQFWPMQQQ